MNTVKSWAALAAVAVVAVLVGGWFLLVSPKHAETADLQIQAEAQRQTNQTLENALSLLKEQTLGLPAEQAKLAAVELKVPDSAQQPALLRGLAAAADRAGVELVSVAPGTPTALAAAGTPAATTDDASTSATDGTTPAASTTAAATTSAGTLMSVPVTMSVGGSYFAVEQYLSALEELSRAFRVTSVALAPGSSPVTTTTSSAAAAVDGGALLVDITGSVFLTSGATPAAAVTVPPN